MSQPKLIRKPDGTLYVKRFSTIRRVEHIITILTFVLLVMTGFPQKFDGAWSAQILDWMGGLETARLIHRWSGLLFVSHAVIHLGAIVVGVLAGVMRLSLLPTPQDLYDAWNNLAYYLGFRESPAALDTFDYRHKFEYIGLVLGGLVMAGTGLVLLFPVATANLLPGQLIPAAMVMHSNEALLALMVLVVWHAYGAVLSPEVFPLDTSIFTGYQSIEDFKHHHALAYYRQFPDGVPEDAITNVGQAPAPPEPVANGAVPVEPVVKSASTNPH